MSDLISRQAAIDEANAWLLDCFKVQKQDRSCGLIRRLEDLPCVTGAEDVAPVVHAHWIIEPWGTNWRHSCSNPKCNHYECHAYEDYRGSNYCPVCGARMDEKEGKE